MDWFFSAGDASFFTSSPLRTISWLPQLWNGWQGFGQSTLYRLWYDYPMQIFIKIFASIGFSWWWIDKILWVVPIFIGGYASWKLARYVSLSKISAFIASFIYVTNTYVLLLFAGGQYGVFVAYCFAPVVLLNFMRIIDGKDNSTVQPAVLLSILIALDLRLAYLVLLMSFLYFIFVCTHIKKRMNYVKVVYVFIASFVIAIGVHAFWILPGIVTGFQMSSLGQEITGSGMITFLSFADFSHSISLLHPNWPENFFGKVYFLQPEFLLLPIFAFGGLCFASKSKDMRTKSYVMYLSAISLLGAFIAKGTQPPFGGIYLWLFDHVPGFVMFRDPTKFYLLISLGYAILIPYTLEGIGKIKKKLKWLVYVGFIVFWCVTIRQVWLGQLSGNFQPQVIPLEYEKLASVLAKDTIPSRMLWISKEERFGFFSEIHPFLTTDVLFQNASHSALISLIGTETFRTSIEHAGVKYLIVPIDVYKRIFLDNYVYDSAQRNDLIAALSAAGYKKDTGFQNLGVFVNPTFSFLQEKPEIVGRQELWAMKGLYISIGTLIACIVVFVMKKHD